MTELNPSAWNEIRSWAALAFSVPALVLAGLSYRRGELHRRHALSEADLARFETYWHEMKAYLSSVNLHRAALCDPMRDLQASQSIEWEKHNVGTLAQPNLLWPQLPGAHAAQCVKVFQACQHAWAAASTFENRLRRREEMGLVYRAEEETGAAIEEADRVLNELNEAVVRERAVLRGQKRKG